jgi:hypothetical protein
MVTIARIDHRLLDVDLQLNSGECCILSQAIAPRE